MLPRALLALPLVLAACAPQPKNELRQPVAALYGVHDPQFRRSMEGLLGVPMVSGNRTATMLNGREIFPAMLAAIRSARRTINFETYIYWNGDIGHRLAEAFAERARAGVEVRAILDWQGTNRLSRADAALMEEAGVILVRFNPLKWYDIRRINNRTHRKLLIVDGRVGFIGGVGISDEWEGNAQDPDHWRDNHYRVDGPAVAQLQSSFMDNWIKARGEILHGDKFYPRLPAAGSQIAQAFPSSPGLGDPAMHRMFHLSLASAQRSIQIISPYFIPGRAFTASLLAARRRGVRVEVIVPGQYIDSKMARAASRAVMGPLLEGGVEIYEFQPTMIHAKLLIVDGLWTSVGSSNFDSRSMGLNDEANYNVLDRAFAARQAAIFERDKARSRRFTLEEWRRRPFYEKMATPLVEAVRKQL